MNLIKTFKTLPVAVVAAAVLITAPLPAGAPFAGSAAEAMQLKAKPKKKQETRKVPAMSLGVHKKVQKAQEAMDEKDLVSAKEILAKILESKKVNDYERAVVWQLTAMLAYEEDDTQGTIRAYEQVLRYKDSIPVAQELSITYGLAQLYYSIEDYDRALKFVKIWEPRAGEFVGVSQLNFIAQLYYVRSEFEQTIEYIDRAIAMALTLDTIDVKENWYGIKLSAHWELNQYDKVRDTLETLLVTWPKPRYWIQLAGVYQELGDENTFFSLMEAAYKQGFLDDKGPQLVNVAQIQVSRDAPIKCAWVLSKGFKEKRIEKTADNLRTLGQCYMQAGEFEKAIAPLKASAELKKDADLWSQVGQVQMSVDDLKGAVLAFDKALEAYKDTKKGSKTSKVALKRFSTTMRRAQALIELKRFKEAKAAFKSASKLAKKGKQKKQVRQWSDYLKIEELREKTLLGTS
jgi:tetratricopeptide (TPR) repeat protein